MTWLPRRPSWRPCPGAWVGSARVESSRFSVESFESDAGLWRGRLPDIRNVSCAFKAVYDWSGEGSDRLGVSSASKARSIPLSM